MFNLARHGHGCMVVWFEMLSASEGPLNLHWVNAGASPMSSLIKLSCVIMTVSAHSKLLGRYGAKLSNVTVVAVVGVYIRIVIFAIAFVSRGIGIAMDMDMLVESFFIFLSFNESSRELLSWKVRASTIAS
ncbi:hypothetical protein ACOSQ2_016937 [Xanthoceras sorbifolium]